MNEAFYAKVMDDVKMLDIKAADTMVREISRTYIEDFKGVPEPVEFRVLQLAPEE